MTWISLVIATVVLATGSWTGFFIASAFSLILTGVSFNYPVNEADTERFARRGWPRALLGFTCPMLLLAGTYLFVHYTLGCGKNTSLLSAALVIATYFALEIGIGISEDGFVGIVLAAILLLDGAPNRSEAAWICWIAALVLVPTATYFVGRLIRKRRTTASPIADR